jgi:hypothetical protein
MKPAKRPLVIAFTIIIVTILLSWTLLNDDVTSATSSSLVYKDKPGDTAISEFIADGGSLLGANQPLAAADVLIQRIPGDNSHLLLMAYYSKENYSGQAITINNEFI